MCIVLQPEQQFFLNHTFTGMMNNPNFRSSEMKWMNFFLCLTSELLILIVYLKVS